MMERKKRKYGKAETKKLTATEDERLKNEICKMKEITELEQNAWREEKRKSQKLESRGTRNIPEGLIRRLPAIDNKEI